MAKAATPSVAGRTINVISLAGVAFAIGMTLDNTIVVLENIERERLKGKREFEAALAGVHAVWPAVLALFVEQEAGQLYSDIEIAISAAILVSMLTAITVVPAACARLPFRERKPGEEAWAPFKGPILGFVGWMIGSAWRRAVCLVLTVGATVAAIVFLTPPAEYLPEGEEAKTFAILIAPPGYSLSEMSGIANEIKAEFVPYLEDDPAEFASGETEVPALLMLIVSAGPQSLRVISETKDPGQIDALMEILTERFQRYPGMRAFASRGSIISSNDGGTRSVNLDISGPELAPIYETALAAYRRAGEAIDGPQINSEPSSLVLGQPLIEVRPRWDRAAELGFSADEIGYAVAALSDGAYVDEFFLEDDKIDIFLYSTARTEQELSRLSDLPVATPAGAVVPVRSVADLIETVDSDAIRRVNGRRTVTLNVIPPRSVALETAVGVIQRDVIDAMRTDGDIPNGVSIDISGASDQLTETREALGGNFVVSVVLSYSLLVVIYRHWGYPWIIMATVPLGIAGGDFRPLGDERDRDQSAVRHDHDAGIFDPAGDGGEQSDPDRGPGVGKLSRGGNERGGRGAGGSRGAASTDPHDDDHDDLWVVAAGVHPGGGHGALPRGGGDRVVRVVVLDGGGTDVSASVADAGARVVDETDGGGPGSGGCLIG